MILMTAVPYRHTIHHPFNRWNSANNKISTNKPKKSDSNSNDFEIITKINERLSFKEPMIVKIKKHENCYNIDWDNANMRIVASGETRNECIKEFLEDLVSNWEYISKASDDELTKRALTAKRWLREKIKEVF